MPSINDVLRDLFSQKLIVKRKRDNSLATVDFSKKQSSGTRRRGKYSGAYKSSTARSFGQMAGYSLKTSIEEVNAVRMRLYADYDAMDMDAHISTALDIYADSVTAHDPSEEVLKVNCPDEKMKKILYNLYYEVLNVEYNLWPWVRETCKYGDYFVHTPIHPEYGIYDAIPIHPGNITRDDFSGEEENLTHFIYEGQSAQRIDKSIFEFHEMAHFRLLGDSVFLPYGKSMLEGGRNIYKQLTMMKDALLIHRIMRAPDRRIFHIDIGAIPPDEVDTHMQQIMENMKKIPYKDDDGNYNLQFNLMNMLEDVFLPVRGADTGTKVDNLSGLKNEGQIDDVEMLREELLSFLKIPKAYMGYESDSEGKSLLASEDVRFAKTIERIQKSMESELKKMGLIQLYMNGYRKEDLLKFDIELAIPSQIYERQMLDIWKEKMGLVADMKELNMFSHQFIYEKIFNMSAEEWKAEKDQVVEDLKHEFRLKQIVDEGNDPKISGEVLGTAHALMMVQSTSKALGLEDEAYSEKMKKILHPDKRHDNPGRPKSPDSFESDRDPNFGRDPMGRKGANPSMEKQMHTPANMKLDHLDRIEKTVKPTKTRLFEDVDEDKRKDFDKLSLSFLDESKLIDDFDEVEKDDENNGE